MADNEVDDSAVPGGWVPVRTSHGSTQNGSCVEIARTHGANAVAVRDSQDPHGPALTFTAVDWQAAQAVKRPNAFVPPAP